MYLAAPPDIERQPMSGGVQKTGCAPGQKQQEQRFLCEQQKQRSLCKQQEHGSLCTGSRGGSSHSPIFLPFASSAYASSPMYLASSR